MTSSLLAPTTTGLDNGLRVVVHEEPGSGLAAVNLWYDVGSRHEELHRTGLAHLFEHLMFEGSANVAAGEHFSLLQRVGGVLNATTSFDRTNYFETVPVGALDLALWLESDRMRSLALTQHNLDNQRDVVKNERRQRYDNVPYGTVWERLFSLLLPEGHPYHHLPIGSMAHLDAASLDDVQSFFDTYYAPSNAVLTVAGDVATEDVVALVKRHFADIPVLASKPVPRQAEVGPMLAATPQVVTDEAVPSAAYFAGYRAPVDGTHAAEATDLALRIIAGGQSSRLTDRLVRKERVAQGVDSELNRLVGGVSVAVLKLPAVDNKSLAALETHLDDELRRLAADGPTQDELDRALVQAESGWFSQSSTIATVADEISAGTTLFGDGGRFGSAMDRLRAVTAGDVREVVAEYFVPDNRAVVAYERN